MIGLKNEETQTYDPQTEKKQRKKVVSLYNCFEQRRRAKGVLSRAPIALRIIQNPSLNCVVAHAIVSQIEAHEIHRGNGLDVPLPLALPLSTIQATLLDLVGKNLPFSAPKNPIGVFSRKSDEPVTDESRAGCPSDFDDNLLKTVLEQNPRQSTRCIAERLNTSQSTIIRHLEQLGKVSKLGVWVPHNLSERNKEDHMSIATSLLSRSAKERQWLDKDEPPLPDSKANIHGKKLLLCVWWDCRGIIYHELLKPNVTITADRYVQKLQRVQEKLLEKRSAFVNRKNVILLHDNA
ncbi:histone-lysine N-methyltransferase SETMAR [Trichonephila clavipes]|nr:histone-lysine N-methyltransferase SETMAR [Trichonephila clavipes]